MDRQQWEYRILTAHVREDEGGLDELRAAGLEGWEAVGMSAGGRQLIVLLKRRIP